MMEEEGIDMSGFNYDDLPDAPELVEPRRGSNKRKSEKPKKKEAKKQKKDKVIGLSSYSESSDRGNSDKSTSGIFTSIQIDTTPIPSFQTTQQTQPPPTHQTTQIPTPIPSAPLQTTTTPIIHTTSDSTHSDIPISQAIPINHPFPPFNQQSDSDVTLSNYSPEKSSDFLFQDHSSPTTESLSKQTQIPISEPMSSTYEPITSAPPTSEPITSAPLTSEPLSSILFIPEPSSPNTSNPSSAVIIFDPKPHNLLIVSICSDTMP